MLTLSPQTLSRLGEPAPTVNFALSGVEGFGSHVEFVDCTLSLLGGSMPTLSTPCRLPSSVSLLQKVSLCGRLWARGMTFFNGFPVFFFGFETQAIHF